VVIALLNLKIPALEIGPGRQILLRYGFLQSAAVAAVVEMKVAAVAVVVM
jgi:hypothetical protein